MTIKNASDLRALRRTIATHEDRSNDLRALGQLLSTLLPLAALWAWVALAPATPVWSLVAVSILMGLFLMRVFSLMHDCGHGSLFRTSTLNRRIGFFLGVLAGMPQPVWAQHHLHHHNTNGNWKRYRGPLNVITTVEYAALTPARQLRYRLVRSIWLAPIGGFIYLLLSPRINWLLGSAKLARHVVGAKIADPSRSLRSHARDFSTPCCASLGVYGHMFWNNVALLAAWGAMAWAIGPARFFFCYVLSLSLAGGAAIVIFTVQHNFEHSYASGDEGWDSGAAALQGTSFLVLPKWLNWFTADIAYHHVHHLCAAVPNYCLARRHDEQAHLFTGVTRIRLGQIPGSLKCILWDVEGRHIVSVRGHLLHAAEAAARAALRPDPVAGEPPAATTASASAS